VNEIVVKYIQHDDYTVFIFTVSETW